MAINKRVVKQILGDLPLAAELYWQIFQRGMPVTRGFLAAQDRASAANLAQAS